MMRAFETSIAYMTICLIVQTSFGASTVFHLRISCNISAGGTLDQRLRQHQIRDLANDQVIGVKDYEPQSLIWRWMAELTDAVAWLESLGYVHGDIRPPNLLLDASDHLKVIDFDNTVAVGFVFDGCQPPYARVLGGESAENPGTFGNHGPRTEQFAIGSVIYYMTRGYEPYGNEWFGNDHGKEVVRLLQERKFPKVNRNDTDTIIRKCWNGEYGLTKSLKLEVIRLDRRIEFSMAKAIQIEECQARRQECKELVKFGVLDNTPRNGEPVEIDIYTGYQSSQSVI